MRWRDLPSGHVDLKLQPNVIRCSRSLGPGKGEERDVAVGLVVGDVRVSILVPDPEELIADLQRGCEWRDTGVEPA